MDSTLDVVDTKDVLYVEDHPVNVLLMEALFEKRPHLRLVVATDGRQACRIAARLRPALLLLDLRLPDCHGADLLRLLRALPNCADVPAVAVTAESGFEAQDTGFVEVWPKPMDLRHVLNRLDQWLTPDTAPMPLHSMTSIGMPSRSRYNQPSSFTH
jgi:CheY-like chemotaxis protein